MKPEYTKLKKKNIDKKLAGVWSLYGPVLAILLCVIIFTLIRFSVTMSEEAKADIYDQLADNAHITVKDASLTLGQIMSAGIVAGGMLGDNGVDYQHWKDTVGHIQRSNSNVYMVTIVDVDGKGVCSIKDGEIDLSSKDYYKQQNVPYYDLIKDDGITNNSALVCVVPISDGNEVFGYINQYIYEKEIVQLFRLEGNDISNGVAIMNNGGYVAFSRGQSPIPAGNNFYSVLCTAEFKDADYDSVMHFCEYNVRQEFLATINGKENLFILIPMDIGEWTSIHVIDSKYAKRMIEQKLKNELSMVKALGFVCALTIIFIFSVAFISRRKDKQLNKDLENKADTDLLTGLNNKIATERKISECLENETDTVHLLLLFDIDNFKKINDTMGHAFGDQVLKTLGDELSKEFRKTDILGRTGGDEFTFLIRDLKTDDIVVKECLKMTNFFNNFKVGDYVKYSATASIGAAVYPMDGMNFEELYKSADSALYEAKKQGKNRLVYHSSRLKDVAAKKETESENKAE